MGNTSYNNQIRQLRILAEAALTHYDIGGPRPSLLSHRTNTLFRVTASPRFIWTMNGPAEQTSEARFVLRLCDPHSMSVEMLHAELSWLAAIRQESDLIVPEPVRMRNGAFVTEIQVEDIEVVRNAMLFRWVEGRFIESGLTPTLFERVGTFMARLHQHASTFVPPKGFVRLHSDWPFVFGPGTLLDPDFVEEHCSEFISQQDQLLLAKTALRVQEDLHDLPKTAEYYGMIHADLQPNNLLFHKGDVGAIDFYDCGWGYYLFDVAVTFSFMADRADEAEMRKAFFKGYQKVRELPVKHEKYLRALTALYIMHQLTALFRSDNPYARAAIFEQLKAAFAWFRRYLSVSVGVL